MWYILWYDSGMIKTLFVKPSLFVLRPIINAASFSRCCCNASRTIKGPRQAVCSAELQYCDLYTAVRTQDGQSQACSGQTPQ